MLLGSINSDDGIPLQIYKAILPGMKYTPEKNPPRGKLRATSKYTFIWFPK